MATASLVFAAQPVSFVDSTSGTSSSLSIRWPRACTRAGTADAARADTMANRRWPTFTCRCQRRQIFVGAYMRPLRHMLPNAAWPERLVPLPATRGIRATARPVPQDMAEVCSPEA